VHSTFYHDAPRPVTLKCSYGDEVELLEDVHVVKATLGCDKNRRREKSENVRQAVQQLYDAGMRTLPAKLLSDGSDLSCRCCPDGPWLSVTLGRGPARSPRSRSAELPRAEASGRKRGHEELNPRDKAKLEHVLKEHGLDVTAHLVLVDALDEASRRATMAPGRYHPPDAFTTRTIGQVHEDLMRYGILKTPQRTPKQLNLTCPTSGCLLTMLQFLMSRGKEYITGSTDDEKDQNKRRFEMELNSVCFYLDMPEVLSKWCALRGSGGGSGRSPCCVLLHAQEIDPQHLKKWAIIVCNPLGEPRLLNLQPEVSEAFKVLERTGATVTYADSSEGIPAGDYDAIYAMGHLNVKGSPSAAALLPKGRAPPKFAVCNGCASEPLAMELHEAGVRFVVCWDAEVPDVVAATFGRELLMRLANVDGPIGKFQIGEAFKFAIGRVPWEAIANYPIAVEDDDDDDVPVATGAHSEHDPPGKPEAAKQPYARAVQQHDDEALARALQHQEYDLALVPDAAGSEVVARALQRESDEAAGRALAQALDDELAADVTRRVQALRIALPVDLFVLVAGCPVVGMAVQRASCPPAAAALERAAAGLKRAAEVTCGVVEAFKRARLPT